MHAGKAAKKLYKAKEAEKYLSDNYGSHDPHYKPDSAYKHSEQAVTQDADMPLEGSLGEGELRVRGQLDSSWERRFLASIWQGAEHDLGLGSHMPLSTAATAVICTTAAVEVSTARKQCNFLHAGWYVHKPHCSNIIPQPWPMATCQALHAGGAGCLC